MDPVTFLGVAVPILVALVALFLAVVLVRNRPFTKEVPVYRSSRLTGGNRFWPTQVAVFPTRVVRWTPRLFGNLEETIAVDQVASVSVDAGMLFSKVLIETTGGSQPIVCHGHWKKDAIAIRAAISAAQDTRRGTA
jgi:hypothetical protein